MTHRLAIIIPAYKATFLPAALDSIAMQTCKDFTLYVGDDCSPEPIGSIVEQYNNYPGIVGDPETPPLRISLSINPLMVVQDTKRHIV